MGLIGALWGRHGPATAPPPSPVYRVDFPSAENEKALPPVIAPTQVSTSRWPALRARLTAGHPLHRSASAVVFAPAGARASGRSSFATREEASELPTHFRTPASGFEVGPPLRPLILSTTRHQPKNPFATPFDAPWER
jgi:hypothetical protein